MNYASILARTNTVFAHCRFIVSIAVAAAVAIAIFMIVAVAPVESTMGEVQKIVYIHVAIAWFALAGMLVTGICGLVYLGTRSLAIDSWAQASGELGWLCSLLTLATGSIWAHEAWNTWWTWEPRLTTMLVLAIIYSGYLLLRTSLDDPHQRARFAAVFGILGLVDLPLIILSTRLFRGIHPISPEMDATMRGVLLVTCAAFSALFAWLVAHRCQQIILSHHLNLLEMRAAERNRAGKELRWRA